MIHVLRTLLFPNLPQNTQLCRADHHDWRSIDSGERKLFPNILCACSHCKMHYSVYLSKNRKTFIYPVRRGYMAGLNIANGEIVFAHLEYVNYDTGIARGRYYHGGRYGPTTSIPVFHIGHWSYSKDFLTQTEETIEDIKRNLITGMKKW